MSHPRRILGRSAVLRNRPVLLVPTIMAESIVMAEELNCNVDPVPITAVIGGVRGCRKTTTCGLHFLLYKNVRLACYSVHNR